MKRIYLLGLLAAAIVSAATAQSPAPIPPAIANAKTVFISNASYVIGEFSGAPTRAYDEFYAGLKASARFQLVDDPAKADLVIELSSAPSDQVSPLQGFRVSIYDSKTHYVLWTLLRTFSLCVTKKGCDKGFEEAINALVRDVVALGGQSAPVMSQ